LPKQSFQNYDDIGKSICLSSVIAFATINQHNLNISSTYWIYSFYKIWTLNGGGNNKFSYVSFHIENLILIPF
jgi:hypothetical protein